MTGTWRILSLAALLTTGAGAAAMAAGGTLETQHTTEVQTGSQQVGRPATGGAVNAPGQHDMNSPAPTYAYPKSGSGTAGMSAQSKGQLYPGVVGPTGSTQPDATNPNRSSPSGGGGMDTGGSSGGGSAGTGH